MMASRTAKTLWSWHQLQVVLGQWEEGEQEEVGEASPLRVCSLRIWSALSRSSPQPLWPSSRTLAPALPMSGPPPPGRLLTPQAPLSPPPLPLPQLCPHPSQLLHPGSFSLPPTTFSLQAPQYPKTCPPPNSSSSWLLSSREPSTSTARCSTNRHSQEPSSTTRGPMPTPQLGPRCPTPLRAH